MIFKNYSLYIKRKKILSNINIEFKKGMIHHILGENGVGKSCFAKSLIDSLPYQGNIYNKENIILIGSYTNIPSSLTVKNILELKKEENTSYDKLYELLKISLIKANSKISELSDGQKQKIKLLFYLSKNPSILILDEFTSALDKKSMEDIYIFLNEYIKKYNILILNITHNLTDLEKLNGYYWYMKNKGIIHYNNKEKIINDYINLI
ncbi:MAG: ATP-binding cassette domain-containing protein [Oscillospiraceae bacterium]|nr:ATP-binding cassette domain-containing protein [Oscillospiraceae bacterium]